MELNIGIFDLLKLLGKLVAHKVQQYRLATNEFEVISTSHGRVRGLKRKTLYDEDDTYYAFEGIPYAKPPVGELRFRAPQPPDPWQDVLDCMAYKEKPVQYHFVRRMIEGSEDCLYLNIYVKKLSSSKPLPVMVWLYGGGFQIGEASRDIYAPDYFMQRDVILVTVAYRLGVFGFLSFNDPDLQIPGNAGLKDQALALKWIKDNIHNFNGDPNNITLFGESAGGAATHLLMLTPRTKGLFHKAIIQSGTVHCPWVFTETSDWAYRLAFRIGYKGNNNDKEVYRYLSKQTSRRLKSNENGLLTKEEYMNHLLFPFSPVIEPYDSEDCIISKSPKEILPTSWSNEIPLIVGGNSFEGLFHYSGILQKPYLINELSDFVNLLPNDLRKAHTEEELKALGLRLKSAYFGDRKLSFKENFFDFMDLMSLRTFWHGIHRTIKARTAYAPHTPTYCYRFDFDSQFFNHYRNMKCGHVLKGVCHGDEISYLFYNISAEKLPQTSREYKCIQRLVGMWYNFALSSNPNCKEIASIKWEPVVAQGDSDTIYKCLNINDELEFKELPMHEKLNIWDSLYGKDNLL